MVDIKKIKEDIKLIHLLALLNLKKVISTSVMLTLATSRVYAAGFDTSSFSIFTDVIELVCKVIAASGILVLIYGALSYLSAYKADSAEGKEKASKELVVAVGLLALGGSSAYFTGKIKK